MSKKNTWESKTSARERLKAERERQAKRDRMRRQFVAGGAIVAALAIAGGIAVAVSNTKSASDKPVVVPANASGTNGTTVVYGNKNAQHTLSLYEDARCPVCAMFEQVDGKDVLKGAQDGRYKIEYTFGTFLDQGASPGTGSMHALSALGAALNVSTDAFIKFHTALYSQANHPEETTDKFSDTGYLFKISDQVPELKGNAAFQKAVKDGTYDGWAKKMSDSFNSSGVQATPSAKIDGKDFPVAGQDFPKTGVITPAQLAAAFDQRFGAKK